MRLELESTHRHRRPVPVKRDTERDQNHPAARF